MLADSIRFVVVLLAMTTATPHSHPPPVVTLLSGNARADVPAVYSSGINGSFPGNRDTATLVCTSDQQSLFLFGGESAAGSHNDLWRYSIPQNQWLWVSGSNVTNQNATQTVPAARSQHTAAIDTTNNTMWIFGGFGNGKFLNDIWHVSLTQSIQTPFVWVSHGQGRTQNGQYVGRSQWSGARLGHVWAMDADKTNVLYMFGGSGYDATGILGEMQDLWMLTVSESKGVNFTFLGGSTVAGINGGNYGTLLVPSSTNQPGSRHNSAMATLSGSIWIFGGQGYASNGNAHIQPLSDLWMYNLTINQWTWMAGFSTAGTGVEFGVYPSIAGTFNGTMYYPGPRYGHIMTFDQIGNLWLAQGNGIASVANITGDLSDLWEYTASSTTRQWTWWLGSPFVNESLDSPTYPGDRRYSAATVASDDTWYSYGGNEVIGINSETGILSDTFKWNVLVDQCTLQNITCQNGATCITPFNSLTFLCICAPGYSGIRCQTNVNECTSQPCENGGTCADLINGYNCSCVDGYTGVMCESIIHDCASQPCQHGGTCQGHIAGYNCTCAVGYSGPQCQTQINLCASLPCRNGGTCVPHNATTYTCTCPKGYTGTLCQTKLINSAEHSLPSLWITLCLSVLAYRFLVIV